MLKKFFLAILLAGIFSAGSFASAETASVESLTSSDLEFQMLYDRPWTRRTMAYWGVVVNCNEWITLRAEPSTAAATVTRIPLGSRVIIYDSPTQNGFYAAQYNGMYGFVLANYIRSTNEAA